MDHIIPPPPELVPIPTLSEHLGHKLRKCRNCLAYGLAQWVTSPCAGWSCPECLWVSDRDDCRAFRRPPDSILLAAARPISPAPPRLPPLTSRPSFPSDPPWLLARTAKSARAAPRAPEVRAPRIDREALRREEQRQQRQQAARLRARGVAEEAVRLALCAPADRPPEECIHAFSRTAKEPIGIGAEMKLPTDVEQLLALGKLDGTSGYRDSLIAASSAYGRALADGYSSRAAIAAAMAAETAVSDGKSPAAAAVGGQAARNAVASGLSVHAAAAAGKAAAAKAAAAPMGIGRSITAAVAEGAAAGRKMSQRPGLRDVTHTLAVVNAAQQAVDLAMKAGLCDAAVAAAADAAVAAVGDRFPVATAVAMGEAAGLATASAIKNNFSPTAAAAAAAAAAAVIGEGMTSEIASHAAASAALAIKAELSKKAAAAAGKATAQAMVRGHNDQAATAAGLAAAKGTDRGMPEDGINRLVENAIKRTQDAISVVLADMEERNQNLTREAARLSELRRQEYRLWRGTGSKPTLLKISSNLLRRDSGLSERSDTRSDEQRADGQTQLAGVSEHPPHRHRTEKRQASRGARELQTAEEND